MAAVNASPTNRGTKTVGPPQQISRQPAHNPSPNPIREGVHAQRPQPGMEQEGIPQRIAYQHLALGQVYVPHNAGSQSVLKTMQVQDHSQNKLTAKALPSEEWYTRKDSEEGFPGTHHEEEYPGKDLEIQHLRTQARSVSVLQELLADSRSEIRALHDVLSEQETLLNQYGLKVSESVEDKLARLRLSCSSVPESEWSVELKRPPFSSHGRTELNGSHQLAELTRQLSAKDEEIATLHRLLRSSEDEKGREIALLKERIQNNCEDQQTSVAICQSLSDETEVLKTRIQRLMDECQGLTRELGNWKRKKMSEKSKSAAMFSETPMSLEDQLRLSQRQIEELELEKSRMSEQLQEVSRMNKRWQKYSRQQDQVKEELTQTKDQLEKQTKTLALQCREYEDSINQLQRRLQKVEEESRHRRVEETRAAGREASCRRLERRVAELEQELERARREGAKYDGEVVKQQLKQYTEDFQKEHTEKEKLKRENLILSRNHQEAEDLLTELDRKVNEVERENQDLRQRLQRVNAIYAYPEERRARELIPHGASQRSPIVSLDNFPTLPRDVQPDGPAPFTPPSSAPRSPPVSPSSLSQSPMHQSGMSPSRVFAPPIHGSLPMTASSMSSGFIGRGGEDCVDGISPKEVSLYQDDDDEPLQCPRCLREFPVSKHSDFIRHMESCLDT